MTDYYTCSDCGGYVLSCGCDKKAEAARKVYWAAEASKRRAAVDCVREFLPRYKVLGFETGKDMSDHLELILRLAERGVAEAERFSGR